MDEFVTRLNMLMEEYGYNSGFGAFGKTVRNEDGTFFSEDTFLAPLIEKDDAGAAFVFDALINGLIQFFPGIPTEELLAIIKKAKEETEREKDEPTTT